MTPPDLIAALDARIDRYQIAREVLLELGAPVLLGPAASRAAPPRALPAGKAAAPAPKELGRSPLVPQILRLLADRGPMQTCDIGRALAADKQTVGNQLKGKTSLFRQLPGNRRSPWELTDAGRRAAAALPPGV